MVDIQIIVVIFFAVHLRATHSGIIPKNNQLITEINELKSYCAILPVCFSVYENSSLSQCWWLAW